MMDNEMQYGLTMYYVKQLNLSDKEFKHIDTIMFKKHCPFLSALLLQKT